MEKMDAFSRDQQLGADENQVKQSITLAIRRAPVLLRVVYGPEGIDTLDQLEDTIRPGETAYVYRLTEPAASAFVDGRDPKTGRRTGGHRYIGKYELLPNQPDQSILVDNEKWRAWCQTAEMPEWAKGAVMP